MGSKQPNSHIKVINFVDHDEIWKQHVRKEIKAAKEWPDDYGFIVDNQKETEKKFIDLRENKANKQKVKLPADIVPRPNTPMETYLTTAESGKFPIQASKNVGWRSGKDDCALEIYGGYARRNGSLYMQLGWPIEGLE